MSFILPNSAETTEFPDYCAKLYARGFERFWIFFGGPSGFSRRIGMRLVRVYPFAGSAVVEIMTGNKIPMGQGWMAETIKQEFRVDKKGFWRRT
jgi:hypothetical protein